MLGGRCQQIIFYPERALTLLSWLACNLIHNIGSAPEVDAKFRLPATTFQRLRNIEVVLPKLIIGRGNMLPTEFDACEGVKALE